MGPMAGWERIQWCGQASREELTLEVVRLSGLVQRQRRKLAELHRAHNQGLRDVAAAKSKAQALTVRLSRACGELSRLEHQS